MNVAVVLEHRFFRTPNGHAWTQAAFAHSFWTRYLDVFSGVHVVARVKDVSSVPEGFVRADGPQVSVASVPYYVGPWQYLKRWWQVRAAVRAAVQPKSAVILRVGSQLANCLFPRLLREQRPYGVEVVGDPWDVFAPGTIRHPLRPYLRRYFTQQLKQQCQRASAAAYVTERTLQARYPLASADHGQRGEVLDTFSKSPPDNSFAISDVELPDSAFVSEQRKVCSAKRPPRLIFVGSLEQLYKGPDILLQAIALLKQQSLDIELTIVGDGRYRHALEKQTCELQLAGQVTFRGQLTAGDQVRQELDRADLFVLPSRTEGLPRALIEAQARGLPCLAADVGGIPELLSSEDLVPPGDPITLAAKIRDVLQDATRREHMGRRNLQRARQFQEAMLGDRRRRFLKTIRDRTDEWTRRAVQIR